MVIIIIIIKKNIFYKNGSMSNSRAEAGMLSSKALNTSGCNTPSFPTTFPRATISAHLPGKNVESMDQRIEDHVTHTVIIKGVINYECPDVPLTAWMK